MRSPTFPRLPQAGERHHAEAYRTAFTEYLRKGTPIRLPTKDSRKTERYVWRTRGDEKVRLSHRRNEGRIFEWADPPETGHPGADHNCRCVAVPYIEGRTEFAYHDITTRFDAPDDRWTDRDFVWHYYFGEGPVTLREIGHLREIAEHYAYNVRVVGAFRRLSNQIASKARIEGPGSFTYEFDGSYEFGDVEWSHGGGTVGGDFSGAAEDRGAMLAIHGETTFRLTDEFIIDPFKIGIDLGLGTPFLIAGTWAASFLAEILKDENRSDFVYNGELR